MLKPTYLQDAANAMVVAAQSGRPVLPILKKRCPHIHAQIVQDGRNRGLLAWWGRSCNVDENARKAIVSPAILQAIGELAEVPMRGRFVHAGLEHTYGYLFSLIETPYGFKRTRWVTTDLEVGFGLDPTLLGDQPNAGTLLGNLTWFLARIAFRGHEGFMPADVPPTVAEEIIQFGYANLKVERMVEQIVVGARPITLFTDIVPFPSAPAQDDKESNLLIYSIQTASQPIPRLITAFPVKVEMVDELRKSAASPNEVPIRLRYNAYVRGLYGKVFEGKRGFEPDVQN